jgi:glycosyltransferase involved in cell wall biosynthesis
MAAQLLDQSKQVLQAALPGFKSDHFNVVCVSSLKERKGQDLFLKHHEQLIDAIPKLNLILIGGSKGKWAQAYLKQLNQLDNSAIQYLGERTDALPFTRAADAVLLPTRSEACPRTVLEAMILKTPIVSAPVGGIPEMLDHGISGMLFAHSNTIEMVEHLARIANNRDFGRILADNAHTKYWETFSRQRQIESYSEAIQHFWPHK